MLMKVGLNKQSYKWLGASVFALAMIGCTSSDTKPEAGASTTPGTTAKAEGDKVSGKIVIDGSSTVAPVTNAVVEEFTKANSGVQVSVSEKGTGAGIKAFIAKEIDICDASRTMKAEEYAYAQKNKVDAVEVPIAFDGITIVVNPKNDFAKSLTVEELKKIWEPDSKINNWKDVRAGFPDKPLKLFGPTTSHGTFEYFTDAVCHTKKKSRSDYQQCTDYNALVAGIAQEEGGLGYVGFNYFQRNKDKMKMVGVDGGKGVVEPSNETIVSGQYSPLSRPLLVYVNKDALARPEVKKFMHYYLTDGKKQIADTGFTPLPDAGYKYGLDRLDKATGGIVFGDFKPGANFDEFLKAHAAK